MKERSVGSHGLQAVLLLLQEEQLHHLAELFPVRIRDEVFDAIRPVGEPLQLELGYLVDSVITAQVQIRERLITDYVILRVLQDDSQGSLLSVVTPIAGGHT